MVRVPMLSRSFIILDSIGETTERNLWRSGIKDWDDFLKVRAIPRMGAERKLACDVQLKEAKFHLEHDDVGHFIPLLHRRDTWRLWDMVKDDALFLDIETTGLHDSAVTTVVGVADKDGFKVLVRDKDLDRDALLDVFKGHSCIVTFNGSMFDVPFLEARFGDLGLDGIPHLDLRFAGKRAGLSGGLKRIEKAVGIVRPDEVEDIDGYEAVRLWKRYERTGDKTALQTLIDYNEEDVMNLPKLADIILERLEKEVYLKYANEFGF